MVGGTYGFICVWVKTKISITRMFLVFTLAKTTRENDAENVSFKNGIICDIEHIKMIRNIKYYQLGKLENIIYKARFCINMLYENNRK